MTERRISAMSDVDPHARNGRTLRCGRFVLPLDRPLVMGIVNITPDSFSDPGAFFATDRAIAHARGLVAEGAHILDLGAESTRPGAIPVDEAGELARLMPVLEAAVAMGVPVSVDTMKPGVMRAALAAGAAMVNDVNGFRSPGAIEAVADTGAALCVMHMQGEPRTMQADPRYDDVVSEVHAWLHTRAGALIAAGVAPDRIVVDPGFGFGKTVDHNLELLRALDSLHRTGCAVLAGLSRKSTLGRITGRPADQRLPASIAAALIAVQNGADIVRVHDVAATVDALAVLAAVQGFRPAEVPARPA